MGNRNVWSTHSRIDKWGNWPVRYKAIFHPESTTKLGVGIWLDNIEFLQRGFLIAWQESLGSELGTSGCLANIALDYVILR